MRKISKEPAKLCTIKMFTYNKVGTYYDNSLRVRPLFLSESKHTCANCSQRSIKTFLHCFFRKIIIHRSPLLPAKIIVSYEERRPIILNARNYTHMARLCNLTFLGMRRSVEAAAFKMKIMKLPRRSVAKTALTEGQVF